MDLSLKTQNPKSHSVDVPNFLYTAEVIKHPDISIGEYTYGIPRILLDKLGIKITIGRFCSIGDNVNISVFSERNTGLISTYPFSILKTDWPAAANTAKKSTLVRGDITIGNDVWIGSNSTILGGVTIGDGAVIGANAVVAKDVEPYSIVVGNPIREVCKRFAQEIIDNLLVVKWWDWPLEKIQRNAGLLASNDFEGLKSAK